MLAIQPRPTSLPRPPGRRRVARPVAAANTPADATATAATVQRVLDLTAGTRRGKSADAPRRAAVVAAVVDLEVASPTLEPTVSPLLGGDWALLWTGPGDPNDAAWEKRSGGLEGPVLAALAPLGRLLGLSGGAVIQSIDTDARCVHNVATFTVLGASGALDVEGTVSVASPTRVDVTFTRFSLRVGSLPELALKLTSISPRGWIEVWAGERARA